MFFFDHFWKRNSFFFQQVLVKIRWIWKKNWTSTQFKFKLKFHEIFFLSRKFSKRKHPKKRAVIGAVWYLWVRHFRRSDGAVITGRHGYRHTDIWYKYRYLVTDLSKLKTLRFHFLTRSTFFDWLALEPWYVHWQVDRYDPLKTEIIGVNVGATGTKTDLEMDSAHHSCPPCYVHDFCFCERYQTTFYCGSFHPTITIKSSSSSTTRTSAAPNSLYRTGESFIRRLFCLLWFGSSSDSNVTGPLCGQSQRICSTILLGLVWRTSTHWSLFPSLWTSLP